MATSQDALPLQRATPLTTLRLDLDPLRAADARELFEVLDDARLHTFTGGAPPRFDDLRARYERLESQSSPDGEEAWLNWTIRLRRTGQAIGSLQADVGPEGVASVSWIVGVEHQRQGYASEAAIALVEWLTTQHVREIRAFIHPRHAASAHVARAAGLEPTGALVDGETVWTRQVR